MRILLWICNMTSLDKVRNERDNLGITSVTG